MSSQRVLFNRCGTARTGVNEDTQDRWYLVYDVLGVSQVYAQVLSLSKFGSSESTLTGSGRDSAHDIT
jgi:hypothetical protein